MKILLIILLIFALALICLLLARWRVRCELVAGRLRLDLLLFCWKIKLVERELLLSDEVAELLRAVAEGDWSRVAELVIGKIRSRGRAGEPEKPNEPEKKRKHSPVSIKAGLAGALAALDVKVLRLTILVGGEPFAAALLAGGVWASLSAGLARLSAAVAGWAGEPPEVGLLALESSLLDSQIRLEAVLSTSVAAVLWQVLRRILAGIC